MTMQSLERAETSRAAGERKSSMFIGTGMCPAAIFWLLSDDFEFFFARQERRVAPIG